MRRRFWLAVACFAANRAGDYAVRKYRETTDAEWDAYAGSVKWTIPTTTVTSGNGSRIRMTYK